MALRKAAQRRSDQDPPDSTPSATGRAKAIWNSFGDIFGVAWFEKFGAEPNAEWQEATAFYSYNQVRAAINRIRSTPPPYHGWLPTLPEFVSVLSKQNIAPPEKPQTQLSNKEAFICRANFMLIQYLSKKTEPCTNAVMAALTEIGRVEMEKYWDICAEEEVRVGEVYHYLCRQWDKQWKPATPLELEQQRDRIMRGR